MNFECVWIQSTSSANTIVGKDYLVSLEDRLRAVEKSITSLQAQAGPNPQPAWDGVHSDGSRDQQSSLLIEQHNNGIPRPDRAVEVSSDALQEVAGLEDSTDGMGAVIFSPEEDSGFFGTTYSSPLTKWTSILM